MRTKDEQLRQKQNQGDMKILLQLCARFESSSEEEVIALRFLRDIDSVDAITDSALRSAVSLWCASRKAEASKFRKKKLPLAQMLNFLALELA